jgi:hypothetical protein
MLALPRVVVIVAMALIAATGATWVMLPDREHERPPGDAAATPPAEPTALPSEPTLPELIPTLAPGRSAEVAGTGQCLNVRLRPSLAGPAVDCLPDGARLRLLSGPVEADGMLWWEVSRLETPTAGWVRGAYLKPADPAPPER